MSEMRAHEPHAAANREPMIRLENLHKRFPGQEAAAVRDLSLDVPAGEVVVMVGPSGCGKTTTLRLINRLIEPTGGRIVLEGEDVTRVNPDRLRRRIGYVIQQVGLFPHMTIADNIATVPRLLGWDRTRIRERVGELLELVGMEPAVYAERYPRELSGGQSQRVGVARAMAADPPVLLMDEPFGAIDPITRERLQDEFLRLQKEVRKTVVFVTHDIDEAVKLGDRIALLREEAAIAQYDPPARILTAPADDFVADFIGTGPRVKGLQLARVGEVDLLDWPVVQADSAPDRAVEAIHESGREPALVLDSERRPRAWVSERDLREAVGMPQGQPATPQLSSDATLHEALDALLATDTGVAAVLAEDGTYRGAIDLATLAAAVRAMRGTEHKDGEEGSPER